MAIGLEMEMEWKGLPKEGGQDINFGKACNRRRRFPMCVLV
jgi:hypothetical protein